MKSSLPLLFSTLFLPSMASADEILVNDANPTTLFDAITSADPGDTVVFGPQLEGQTILLGGGTVFITIDLTLDGSGVPGGVTISGENLSRVFQITGNHSVFLTGLNITNGKAPNGGGGGSGADGGGIRHESGDLVLRNCHVAGNVSGFGDDSPATPAGAGGNGGGIYTVNGTLTLIESSVSDNTTGYGGSSSMSQGGAGGSGGGLFNFGSTVTIVNSSITGNHTGFGGNAEPAMSSGSGGFGGGIYSSGGTVLIQNSTVAENVTGSGASTGTNRQGGRGGGIHCEGSTITLENATVTGNLCGNGLDFGGKGGGIAVYGTLNLANSIIAENHTGTGGTPSGFDIQFNVGMVNRSGVNLIGDNDTVEALFPLPLTSGEPNANGDLVGENQAEFDPLLGDLETNANGTAFRKPLPGSPVIDAGDNASAPQDAADIDGDTTFLEPIPIDQIGGVRISGPKIDLGSVEDQSAVIAARQAAIRRAALLRQIQKITKQVKLAKRKGLVAKSRKLQRKIRNLRRQLARI